MDGVDERGVAASEREQEKAERCCVVVWRSAVSLESVSAPRCGMMACTPPLGPLPSRARASTHVRTHAGMGAGIWFDSEVTFAPQVRGVWGVCWCVWGGGGEG